MSKTEQRMATRIEELPAGSLRRTVLESARRFKASWVELARLLSEVKRKGSFRDWGFDAFETYCTRELFIRKQTAEKLTMSYGFLERHEPDLARDPARPAPPFEVIDVLSRAEAQGRLPAGGWRELRDEVLDNPPPAAALARQLTEKYGPPEKAARPPQPERLARLASSAGRLAEACAAEKAVPKGLSERAAELARALAALANG
ncbi:MAG: hypothetical protein HZB56_20850 [Deltaproteobacteria bacterium]|nr:hypothetical protein [Deltaproteobacteria bacterium]